MNNAAPSIKNSLMRLPNGLTINQDKFCVLFVEYGDGDKAFQEAFSVSRANPKDLETMLTNNVCITRITELYTRKMEVIEASGLVNVDILVKEFEAIRIKAMATGQLGAANTAVMNKAKLAGLIIDKTQVTIKRIHEMTDDELRYLINGTAKDVTPAHEGKH